MRANERFTILRDLYSAEGWKQCVGFTIKGSYYLRRQQGWGPKLPVLMSRVLDDAALANTPEPAVRAFIEYVGRPLIDSRKIEQVEADHDVAPNLAPQPT